MSQKFYMSKILPAILLFRFFWFIFTADMVKRFRVDGIPHLAFIDSNLEVKTALVGAVPKPILKDQILALLQVTKNSTLLPRNPRTESPLHVHLPLLL